MSTADKLLYLQDTKVAIKNAIVAKGVPVPTGTTFRDYATKIGSITTGGTGSETAEPWVRPAEWLPLPDNVDLVQKVSILNAVFDTDSEFVAMIFEGDYTVDWGDGIVENFASGIKAEHKYTYSDVDLNSDAVATFGYKQCIITITPQSGQNLTLINLNQYHTSIGNGTIYDLVTGFLDMRINALSCTTLVIGAIAASEYVQHRMLEQCVIGQIGNILDSSSMFQNCNSLQSVPLFNLASVTTTSQMFYNCINLQSVPLFNLASATTTSQMFQNCYSLQSVPLFNLASVTTTTQMFQNCYSLQSVPLFNLASVTTTTQMFHSCINLQSVPLFNLASATTTSQMFYSCNSLQSVPLFNLASVTTTSSMFYNCINLQSVPLFNLASATTASSMFYNCISLQSVPLFNLSSITNNNNILFGCYSLKKINLPLRFTFSVANAKMSATALNEMYSMLPTVTGQTVTVTGNYGTGDDDPSIATANGWTVSG